MWCDSPGGAVKMQILIQQTGVGLEIPALVSDPPSEHHRRGGQEDEEEPEKSFLFEAFSQVI